jgi:ubiquinone/menaquinone biosynthesis C-methylase UbiE
MTPRGLGVRIVAAMPSWYPNEAGHGGSEHFDPDYVAGYDRKSGTDVEADLSVLRTLGLGAGSTLVDLGAGTGALAIAAAQHCRRVVAVDVSPAMLAVARRQAQQAGATNVEFVEAGFLTYEHRGGLADVVTSRHALHHLPDFWKAVALTRIAALLLPGGRFRLRDLLWSFEPPETADYLEAWFKQAVDDPAAGWTRVELEQHVRDEHSTFTWLLEPMLEHAGFDITEKTYAPSRTYATYTCVKRA